MLETVISKFFNELISWPNDAYHRTQIEQKNKKVLMIQRWDVDKYRYKVEEARNYRIKRFEGRFGKYFSISTYLTPETSRKIYRKIIAHTNNRNEKNIEKSLLEIERYEGKILLLKEEVLNHYNNIRIEKRRKELLKEYPYLKIAELMKETTPRNLEYKLV